MYVFVNPGFDARFKCGISRLYQVFSQKHGFKLEIIDEEFLKNHIPAENSPDILVIAGGDGTIHKVINILPEEMLEKYILGIIPGGTANEFAKSISVPLVFEEAAEIIAGQKNITREKIGVINKKYRFVTGFLYGIACKVLQDTTEKLKFYLGQYAYRLPGFLSISNYQEFIKSFRIGSTEFSTAYLLINNASLLSKNIPADSIETEDKDLFSVVFLHSDITFGDLVRVMIKNQAGGNVLDDPSVFYTQMEDLSLEFEGNINFMLDGENYETVSPIKFEHSKYEIKVITGFN